MEIGKLIVNNSWVLLVAAAALLVHLSHPRQRNAVLLGILVPGLGHLYIGERRRALFVAAIIYPMFLMGMVLADFRNISPFDRHPLWGLAQYPGGLLTLGSWLATRSLVVVQESALYTTGCLYSGAACLLNLIAACDLWDLTESEEQKSKRKVKTAS